MPACRTKWWRCATAPWAGIWRGLPATAASPTARRIFQAPALAWAKSAAEKVARKFGVERIDRAQVETWRKDTTRTTYIFDVRDPAEFAAGHFPEAISAPGGQLVQATDIYAGTLGARIVLSDDQEARALMTASWLKQMGWKDVYVLPEAGQELGQAKAKVLGATPADAAIDPGKVLEIDDVTVVDLSTSPHYRRGHIPGAWFAIRGRLDRALKKIEMRGALVLTSEDGVLAGLAVEEARALTKRFGALAQGWQCRLGRRRISALNQRANGRRCRRRLAQTL